jgi:hypothetical protein
LLVLTEAPNIGFDSVNLSFESVPTLLPFAEVSRRLKVCITIRGSLVRRLVRTAIWGSEGSGDDGGLDSPDLLFRLTPFTSDIDIEHSGSPELNSTVHTELISSVSAACAIRLEVRSEQQSKRFLEERTFQASAPVLSMSLSSDGFYDLEGGEIDIANRVYRFRANPNYQSSQLYRSGQDLEVFSMLLFLKAVLEDGAELPNDFIENLRRALGAANALEGTYLWARLRYLLAGIWGVPHRSSSGREVLSVLRDLFLQMTKEDWGPKEQNPLVHDCVMIISAWLGNRAFRFPITSALQPTEREMSISETDRLEVAEGQRCIAASEWLTLTPGISDCTIKRISHDVEFVHLLLRVDRLGVLPHERYITACWALKGESRIIGDDGLEEMPLIFPAPTVCHFFEQGEGKRLSVRSNLLDLGGLFSEFKWVKARAFLLCVEVI